MQTKVYYMLLYSVLEKTTHKASKVTKNVLKLQKTSPVSMLLIQLDSINVFYAMW